MADTIEDEPTLSAELKRRYEHAFLDVVTGGRDARGFCEELKPLLSAQTLLAERELMDQLPLVLEVNRALSARQQHIILNCLKVMTRGMHEFQAGVSLEGMATRHELDRYCYCVAGVVGEMLTDLFIDFAPELAVQRRQLLRLSISFGFGLQLTNILKDQWEDRQRGVCWLPRDLFAEHAVDLAALQPGQTPDGFQLGMNVLLGTAHAHLREGLEYACRIPAAHPGIRRFILWSIGLAVLTLQRLRTTPGFRCAEQVKVTHAELRWIMWLTRLSQHSVAGLRGLFNVAARGMPLTPLGKEWQMPPDAPLWPKQTIGFLSELDIAEQDMPVRTARPWSGAAEL